MLFNRWSKPGRLFASLFARIPSELPGVAAASEFETMFRREVARSDRSARPLSLVVLIPTDETARDLPRLCKSLVARIRLTDSVGFLDSQRIAVLLPETSGPSAWRFADDVLALLGRNELAVNCAVYTYPHDWLGTQHDGTQRTSASKEFTGVSSRNGSRAGRVVDLQDSDHDDDMPGTTGPDPFGGGDRGNGTTGESGPARPRREAKRDSQTAVAERPLTGRRNPSISPSIRSLPTKEARSLLNLPRQHVEGLPIGDLSKLMARPMPFWKRAMDVVGSSVLLVLLSPVLAAIAIAIKRDTKGPVIFAQQRAGRGGVPFKFYKFRSMRITAESERAQLLAANEQDGPVFKIRNDPRITRVGRWIRKTSLDELPQLWNVLKGDMTLVGPRPPTLDELPSYENWHRRRLDVIGGITCSWQVSGRNEIGFADWMRMDLRYARRQSVATDLSLLARTVIAVGTMRGAY